MIVEATLRHVLKVARSRDEHDKTVAQSNGIDHRARAVELFRASGWRKAWVHDGECLAVAGVIGTLMSSDGELWLVSSSEGRKLPLAAVREAQTAMSELLQTYRTLVAKVPEQSPRDIRFAEFLGFKFDGYEVVGDVLVRRGELTGQKASGRPFIIYSMPRSRTAWLCEFLSYGKWRCHHDTLARVPSLKIMRELLLIPRTGICETAMAFAAPAMRCLVPQAKIIVIRRKSEDIAASLARHGEAMAPGAMSAEEKRLEEISALDGVLTVNFDELATEDGCRRVFEHCLEIPFDRAWWLWMKDQNIQVDLHKSVELGRERMPVIDSMRDEAARIVSTVTIAEENFATFTRDKSIFWEHEKEAVDTTGLPFDPPYDEFAKQYAAGMLQITTARVGPELVGYVVFQVVTHPRNRHYKLGIQTVFFVKPRYRGKTGLKLHAEARRSLKRKGVRFLTLRSGIKGVGDRQEALFRRLGATEDGHMFALDMGA